MGARGCELPRRLILSKVIKTDAQIKPPKLLLNTIRSRFDYACIYATRYDYFFVWLFSRRAVRVNTYSDCKHNKNLRNAFTKLVHVATPAACRALVHGEREPSKRIKCCNEKFIRNMVRPVFPMWSANFLKYSLVPEARKVLPCANIFTSLVNPSDGKILNCGMNLAMLEKLASFWYFFVCEFFAIFSCVCWLNGSAKKLLRDIMYTARTIFYNSLERRIKEKTSFSTFFEFVRWGYE